MLKFGLKNLKETAEAVANLIFAIAVDYSLSHSSARLQWDFCPAFAGMTTKRRRAGDG